MSNVDITIPCLQPIFLEWWTYCTNWIYGDFSGGWFICQGIGWWWSFRPLGPLRRLANWPCVPERVPLWNQQDRTWVDGRSKSDKCAWFSWINHDQYQSISCLCLTVWRYCMVWKSPTTSSLLVFTLVKSMSRVCGNIAGWSDRWGLEKCWIWCILPAEM